MVAASIFVGSLFAVGGYNNEVVIVADEGYLVYYSSKTLHKLRSQRVSDARIVGVCAVTTGTVGQQQHYVHAVDTLGNYYIVDVATNYVAETCKMSLTATIKDGKPVIGAHRNPTSLYVISAQWASIGQVPDWTDTSSEDDLVVPATLRLVLLTPQGVFSRSVSSIIQTKESASFEKVISFPGALPDLLMAVGASSGLILVGQRHRTWLWIASAADGAKGTPLRNITLPARLMSLAINPSGVSTAFAIGGDRGEIAYYPTANIVSADTAVSTTDASAPLRFFSDHWHSTPLQALAFTEDGRTLLSAAAEKALVSWSVSGAFTRQKIISNRREELTEGYLWKTSGDKKDKKGRFRPKNRKNGAAEAHAFITTDVVAIIIPYTHGSLAPSTQSPFTVGSVGCYVVGVTGQVAAMDLREHTVCGSADGFRWSMSVQSAGVENAPSLQAEAIEWMGRPALLVVSPLDSEIRIVDPITQQSLYTHHTRFNLETSLVNGTVRPSISGVAAKEEGPLGPYFAQNKEAINNSNAKGTIGTLLATVADGGRLIFTYEDLAHLGLDSVLRVWRYEPTKQQHLEVQAIHNPHPTEVLKMQAVSVKVPRRGADEETFDVMTLLVTLDRLGVKCWRSVKLPSHEARGLTSAQRNFLHLGGLAGLAGEKEADTFMWRVVGSNVCASGRASTFEMSPDGSVLLVADEVVRAYEVPIEDLSLAFSPTVSGRGFAVVDWDHLFTLKSNDASFGTIDTIRFITDTNAAGLPYVFARSESGQGCCWEANQEGEWSVAWESSNIHSAVNALTSTESVTIAVAEKEANQAITLVEINIQKGKSTRKVVCSLPTPTGQVHYIVLPHSGPSSSSNDTTAMPQVINGRLMGVDAAGIRTIPVAATVTVPNIEAFNELKVSDANRVDIFFKGVQQQMALQGEEDDNPTNGINGTLSTSSAQGLLSKVLGSEAYAAPSVGLILSSLLGVATRPE